MDSNVQPGPVSAPGLQSSQRQQSPRSINNSSVTFKSDLNDRADDLLNTSNNVNVTTLKGGELAGGLLGFTGSATHQETELKARR